MPTSSNTTCSALIPYTAYHEVVESSFIAWQAEQQREQITQLLTSETQLPQGKYVVTSGQIIFPALFKPISEQPTIIYLKGTSSAGKTSFGRTFEKNLNNWIWIDEDSICYKLFLEVVRSYYSNEYLIVHKAIEEANLYHAFYRRDIVFRRTATPCEREDARTMLDKVSTEMQKNTSWKTQFYKDGRSEVIRRIEEAYKQQKKVLLDSCWFTAQAIQEQFPSARIIRMLFYCPLQVAFARLQKRNNEGLEKGTIQEKRYLEQLLGSFCTLYQLTEQPERAIDSIEKTVWQQALQQMTEIAQTTTIAHSNRNLTNRKDLLDASLEKIETEFIKPFDEKKRAKLYIASRDEQDAIINTAFLFQ